MPKKPPPAGDHEPPPKPKRFWWRSPRRGAHRLRLRGGDRDQHPALRRQHRPRPLAQRQDLSKLDKQLANVNGGEPETILIIGSDKRATSGRPGPLGHDDPAPPRPRPNAIALISIPRDLKVDIPGFGTEKFNAAYTYGGPKLTLQVVKELTGLQINHVVNVDFLGFVRAVDAIGCVYVDVDRRYYH